jgi:putative endonuclease
LSDESRRREQRGRDAESRAAAFLQAQGYVILARRVRTLGGEVDIVAHRPPVLAFVEVKARSSIGKGLYSLSLRQASRIATAAEHYLSEYPDYADSLIRLDVIAVAPGQQPAHFPNAWQSDG